MLATRSETGVWTLAPADGEIPPSAVFCTRLLRYLHAMDQAFVAAADRCECEFILALLRVRGEEAAGWDPFETTLRAIPALTDLHDTVTDFETARHLQLWIYGHITEASEPYELLANMIAISQGGRWHAWRFPPIVSKKTGRSRPQTPGEKIAALKAAAVSAGLPRVTLPMEEVWDKNFRNAIFHADYALHGNDVRILRPTPTIYSAERVIRLVNRAGAYHTAIGILLQSSIGSYTEPATVLPHPEMLDSPSERAVVVVREGHGVIGLKEDPATCTGVPFFIGSLLPQEAQLLAADRRIAFFPRVQEPQQ